MSGPWWEDWRAGRVAEVMLTHLFFVTGPLVFAIALALYDSWRSRPQGWRKSTLWGASQLGVPVTVFGLGDLAEAFDRAGHLNAGGQLLFAFLGAPLLASIVIVYVLIRERLSDRWVVITIALLATFSTYLAMGDLFFLTH